MAPTKGGARGGKSGPPKSKVGSKSGGSKVGSKISKSSSLAKSKKPVPVKTTQQKTKPLSHRPAKKKRRVYTDKELNIPKLNGIVPAGVAKAHGTKKGKTFVDDGEGMMAILAMVQAEQEGDIESKMMRARQMEEVREAKRAEAEKREGDRKARFEEVKDEVRRDRKKSKKGGVKAKEAVSEAEKPLKKRKKVSFG